MKRLYWTLFFVLIAIGVAGFVFWRYFLQATIAIDPVPSTAVVTINGTPIADRTFHVNRGQYMIAVSAPGYQSQSFKVNVGIGSRIMKRVVLASLPRPTRLLDGPLRSLTLSGDRKTLFFERGGVLYLLDLTAASPIPVPITPVLTGIGEIDWSPDFALALIHKTNGEVGLYDFNRYDLLHQEYRPLPSGVGATAWAADASGFYYDYQDMASGEHAIIKADRAGANPVRLFDWRSVANFPLATPKLTTGPGSLLLLTPPNKKTRGDLFIFDTFQKTPPAAITESGHATGPILSPDKSRLLYTDNGELVVSDISGSNKRNLTLRPRPGNYSFVDNSTVAVLLPNQLALVNTLNGSLQNNEIYAPSDKIETLFTDPAGSLVYYTYQDKLYTIKIKK